LANAGHLPPLLLHDGRGEFIQGPVGIPLGIGEPAYESTTVSIAPNSTLIAYTDGLIERRRESLEDGMDRLRRAASVEAPSVEALVVNIVDSVLMEHVGDDDTAILGIRWLD
jgi:serine phosphatase RsbU (regulator of sigma subunit)